MLSFDDHIAAQTELQTLAVHLRLRYEQHLAETNAPTPADPGSAVDAFVAFADAEMAANPIISTSYGETGMVLNLRNLVRVLVGPPPTAPARPNPVYGVSVYGTGPVSVPYNRDPNVVQVNTQKKVF